MGMDDLLAGRPGEDGKPAVLGGDEGDGILLAKNKLRRGKVPGTAVLRRMDNGANVSDDGFGYQHLVDRLTV